MLPAVHTTSPVFNVYLLGLLTSWADGLELASGRSSLSDAFI